MWRRRRRTYRSLIGLSHKSGNEERVQSRCAQPRTTILVGISLSLLRFRLKNQACPQSPRVSLPYCDCTPQICDSAQPCITVAVHPRKRSHLSFLYKERSEIRARKGQDKKNEMESEIHLQARTTPTSGGGAHPPRIKPPPQSASISAPFSYSSSDDGSDENLLILLHGLGSHSPSFFVFSSSLSRMDGGV